MKAKDIITAVDCCFRINKQHAMLSPHCEDCPYNDPSNKTCVESLVSDIKQNLFLVIELLDEVNEPAEHVLSGLHIVTHEVECALERSAYYSCERAEICLQRNDCRLNQSRYNVNQWR